MGIFYKIYAVVTGLMLLVIGLFMSTAIRQEERLISKSLDQDQQILASTVSLQIQTGYFERMWPFELLNEISKDENFLFWHIIDGNANIRLTSEKIDEIPESEKDFFANQQLSQEKINTPFIIKDAKVWCIPLDIKEPEDKNKWVFCLGYSTQKLSDVFWSNFFDYLFLALILIIVAFPATSLLMRKALKPLYALADSTTQIKEGIFDVNLPSSKTKEINKLITAYRAMLDGLKQKDKKINEQIEQINTTLKELENLNQTLEDKVADRTKELNESNEQLKQLSAHLSLEKEKAESAKRSITSFLANMSHEIRTPLNAIIGFSTIMERREKDAKKLQKLSHITIAGKTLLSLINDILDMSKIEANQMQLVTEKFDFREVFNEVRVLFFDEARKKNIKYQINYPGNFRHLLIADSVRIKQILINLVGNAFKFTEKGSITVNVDIRVKTWRLADFTIEVTDTGAGIEEEQQKRIFDAFVQKEGQSIQKYGGTGLGLAISLRLARLMNGELFIKESTLGKGSTFALLLTDVDIIKRKKEEEISGINEIIVFENKMNILYVDDIKANIVVFREFLKESCLNYELFECNNGKSGIETALSHNFDIIFVDLKMPPPDGIEVTKTLKQHPHTASVPIIALTAFTEKSEHRGFLNAGGLEVLLKPIQSEKLLGVLQKYLATKIVEEEKI